MYEVWDVFFLVGCFGGEDVGDGFFVFDIVEFVGLYLVVVEDFVEVVVIFVWE